MQASKQLIQTPTLYVPGLRRPLSNQRPPADQGISRARVRGAAAGLVNRPRRRRCDRGAAELPSSAWLP